VRIRDDWPGSLCLHLLTAWVALPLGAYLFWSSGKTLGPVMLVVSGPLVAVVCVVFPSLYWRTRKPRPDRMPKLSRAVTAAGAAVVVGLVLWYVTLQPPVAIVPLLEVTPEERAQMEAQEAFENAKLELSKARAETQRAEAALLEARDAPAVRAILDAGGAQ